MFGFSLGGAGVDVKEAHARLLEGGDHVLVDVRSHDEVRAQGIRGAVNVPLDRLEQAAEQLKGYESVHIICRSGGRSTMATQMLHELGVTHAKNVSGGLIAWESAGLPTV